MAAHVAYSPSQASHWNSLIKHQAKLKQDDAILETYAEMQSLGVLPNIITLPLILKACGNLRAIETGERIINSIKNTGMIDHVRVGTSLVDFYCKCGCLEAALNVFEGMPDRDVVAWNAMMSGCVECGNYEGAVQLVVDMQRENMRPNRRTMVPLLLASGELMDLRTGKEVHGYSLRNGLLDCNAHVEAALIGFYLKFDAVVAYRVFEYLKGWRSNVSWNVMLQGYFDVGEYPKALELFAQMIVYNVACDLIAILIVIQVCGELGSLQLGMQVHQLVVKCGFSKDLHIMNALMNMYEKLGCLNYCSDLFELASIRDVAMWNSLISAYIENGLLNEAISLVMKLQLEGIKQDERTIAIVIPLCIDLTYGLLNAKSLHACVIKRGMEDNNGIRNALLNVYSELDSVVDALEYFSGTSTFDIVSWNIMILALAHKELSDAAFCLFHRMHDLDIRPNSHTIISILAACSNERYLNTGKSIHGYMIKHGVEIDPPLNTALTEMYMNCGDQRTARSLFGDFHDKDLISWNAMIAVYANNNQSGNALSLFREMIMEVEPNSVTIVNVLSSCTHLTLLPQGKCIHAYTIRRQNSVDFDLSLANAFISMYARCGCMKSAEHFFEGLPRRNVVSWNAIISGYGMHGRGSDAIVAFSRLIDDGFKPNKITFVSTLSACSHSGLIEEGLQLYQSMIQNFHITPEVVHYACVVDLLARGGRLNEAWEVINSMPIAPDASLWRALLGACRVYGETSSAQIIFEKLVELEPENAGNYILLSNIYAAAGLWSEVRRLRKLLEEKNLKKPPGKSWIVVKDKVHQFTAGDRSHPQSAEIYDKLSSVLCSIKAKGYVPDLSWVLHDEKDEEKLKRLASHSEKLAIAFSLITVRGGAPIMVTKNLRVCGDCHEFSKYVSKLVGRKIVLRDGSRFHHFTGGVCSCKDYW